MFLEQVDLIDIMAFHITLNVSGATYIVNIVT